MSDISPQSPQRFPTVIWSTGEHGASLYMIREHSNGNNTKYKGYFRYKNGADFSTVSKELGSPRIEKTISHDHESQNQESQRKSFLLCRSSRCAALGISYISAGSARPTAARFKFEAKKRANQRPACWSIWPVCFATAIGGYWLEDGIVWAWSMTGEVLVKRVRSIKFVGTG